VSPRALRERPGHRATTASVQAIYPFVTEAGLGSSGVYLGRDLYGGSFVYDPFALYEQRVLTNPNMLVIGEVGAAKSSLVKTYCYRQAVFGRHSWIGDPKGEYGPLARALGVEPIKLVPGGAVRLNPLDGTASQFQRLTLTQALTATALGRGLEPEEHAAIREALRALVEAEPNPVLPDLVRLLFQPTEEMASRLYTSQEDFTRAARPSALGLQRLCEGELRGMLDGRTSVPIDPHAPVTVMDLSAFYDSSALAIVMTCAAAFQRAVIERLHSDADASGTPAPKFINVFDEAWRVLSVLGVGEWLQDLFKKSRSYGVQNVLVMHRLSDLSAAGAAGSREVALAEGLLHDAQTRVVYRQVQDELPRTREALGLTTLEGQLLPTLDPGVALWKLGARSFLVQHRLSAPEARIVDTDGRMRDRV
jgi:type IV secretory pathway VirB4 component